MIPQVLFGYVLKLENGKYYVGISENLNKRIGQHMASQGSKWTREHHPIGLIGVQMLSSYDKEWEKATTFQMMLRFGWENVRGASWCRVEMKNVPKGLFKSIKNTKNDNPTIYPGTELQDLDLLGFCHTNNSKMNGPECK